MRSFILAAIAALGICNCPAQAETLQKKHGPSWNCSYISVELQGLYKKCLECDSAKQDIARTGYDSGICINKASLRENLTTRPDYESPQEERMRLNGAAAVSRELQEAPALAKPAHAAGFGRFRNRRWATGSERPETKLSPNLKILSHPRVGRQRHRRGRRIGLEFN